MRRRRQCIHLLQNGAGVSQKLLAGLCGPSAAAEPLEHDQAGRFLELPNAAAERRLPKKQRHGGAPKASMLRC
jgi:hypothetical protein